MSAASDRPVGHRLAAVRLHLILAVVAIVVALPISIAFGIYLARPGTRTRELGLSIDQRLCGRYPGLRHRHRAHLRRLGEAGLNAR